MITPRRGIARASALCGHDGGRQIGADGIACPHGSRVEDQLPRLRSVRCCAFLPTLARADAMVLDTAYQHDAANAARHDHSHSPLRVGAPTAEISANAQFSDPNL